MSGFQTGERLFEQTLTYSAYCARRVEDVLQIRFPIGCELIISYFINFVGVIID